MESFIKVVLPSFFGLLLILLLRPFCTRIDTDAYVSSSRSTSERAGYEWVGCETTWDAFYLSARTVCLVRIDGKVVDIDHVRAQ